jgi:hypothetical protein
MEERGAPSSLRGWLSDVYLTGLVEGQTEQIVRRLGERSTVDDPIFGRAHGVPALPRHLEEVSAWLRKHEATFDKQSFTMGSDRDVTEGVLALTFDGRRATVPVAIVAERRREREVEMRLYYSTMPIKGTRAARSPLLPQDDEVAVPPPVEAHLRALARADIAALVASFENGATLRDAQGGSYDKDAGAIESFYRGLFSKGPAGTEAGVDVLKGARADDGRTCALEYTVVRVRGRDVAPQAGLAVYERGESGLLRSVRLYEDADL